MWEGISVFMSKGADLAVLGRGKRLHVRFAQKPMLWHTISGVSRSPINFMIAGPYVATKASQGGWKYAGNMEHIPLRTFETELLCT
jgi:hypothetical protein